MKLAAAKLPCTTEFVDRTSTARIGFEGISAEKKTPRVTTLGAVQAAQAAAVESVAPARVV